MRTESLATLFERVDALTHALQEPQVLLGAFSSRIPRNQATGDDFAEHSRLSEHIGALMEQLVEVRAAISLGVARRKTRDALMPALAAVLLRETEIDVELNRYRQRQRALEARRGTGVLGFDDAETHARLGAYIARLAEWQAQARSARLMVMGDGAPAHAAEAAIG
jgi:hypothetical protein